MVTAPARKRSASRKSRPPLDRLTPGPEWARAASLRYASDDNVGITRHRSGTGFSYRDAKGTVIRDRDTRARIAALVIPPAWSRLWLAAPVHSRERVLAVVVRLLETTYIRVGNEEYARDNGTFGLTTLRNRHLRVSGDTLHFAFKGKSGKLHSVLVTDRRLAGLVRGVRDLPGQLLFQYRDDAGELRPVGSASGNVPRFTRGQGGSGRAKGISDADSNRRNGRRRDDLAW